MFLVYGGDEELIVNGYIDASFTTDPGNFKSQLGYEFTLKGGTVSWKSSKQNTIADFTIEEEYITDAEGARDGVWVKCHRAWCGYECTRADGDIFL
jgi:hypothetical protein